jgi:hypothetical protein
MNDTFWTFAVSPWRILLGCLFFVSLLWLSIQSIRRSGPDKWLIANEAIRLIVAALLLFTLFRPELVRLTKRSDRPVVGILCDASESMETEDVLAIENAAVRTRKDWLTERREGRFWESLEEKYDIVVDDFSRPPETNAPSADTDPGTDINAALDGMLGSYEGLRAVLLLSDGDWNEGKSPVSAATKFRMRDIPVFPVVVGSDEFLPDVDLQSVSAPAYGLMDEHISLPFTVRNRLAKDVKATVTLEGPTGVEASKEVVIPAMAEFQSSIVLVPRVEGDYEYTLKVPVQKEEKFTDNNSKTFKMSLRKELLKVLVVDSVPRWEYRFLHNALSRDPGVDVECLLLHPKMAPGDGKNYVQAFPGTKEQLSGYDVVFLGDVGIGPSELTSTHAELLKGLVEQQGSGLVFLPGMRGRQATLTGTVLGDMMPVELDRARQSGVGYTRESKLSLTTRGKDHLLTMLAQTPSENYSVWKQLPGVYWHAPVLRAKPGTTVLAVHATARNQYGRLPLLVTRPAGNGKVLFMGTDSAWRWRRGVEDTYHYRFWGQVVRWMAHQRHLAHQEGMRFFYSPESPSRGNTVFLHATVFDASGFPFQGGEVTARISSQSGWVQELKLEPEKGGWGVFTGSFIPEHGGTHDILIECEDVGRRVRTQLRIESPKRERTGRPARAGVLREVAAITLGRCSTTEELDEVVGSVNLLPEFKPTEHRFRLWCHPFWAVAIILLMGVYWSNRKLLGML